MAMADEIYTEYMPLSRLVRAPRNPKEHDLGTIAGMIEEFGYVNSMILDDSTGRLVAGHGRLDALQAMKARGEPPPRRIRVEDGEWFVPVQRGVAFDTPEQAEKYVVADNRSVELGGWDETLLAETLSDLAARDALEGTGWDGDDLDALLRGLGDFEEPVADPGAQIDRADELQAKWQVERGQVWEIPIRTSWARAIG